MTFFRRIPATNAPAAVILVRLLVGGVFLSEGIQKFLFPDALGVGRFTKIGIPAPEVMAPFVGGFEIGYGTLVLLGLLTHARGDLDHEGSHPAQRGFLEDGARGPHRLGHVAGVDLPPCGRGRAVVP